MSGPSDLAFPGEPDYRDSPLLDAIRQGPSEAHSRLRDSWSVASDTALLQAATDSLPGVARGRPEEVPDALRLARRMGVITAITSMGVILTSRGLCLTATVTGSYDAQTFVSHDVPLMVAAGGPWSSTWGVPCILAIWIWPVGSSRGAPLSTLCDRGNVWRGL